jgi:hypothetical protein
MKVLEITNGIHLLKLLLQPAKLDLDDSSAEAEVAEVGVDEDRGSDAACLPKSHWQTMLGFGIFKRLIRHIKQISLDAGDFVTPPEVIEGRR